jgi:hypothetical protein
MVAADATEVQVVNYLRPLASESGDATNTLVDARIGGTALWDVAKAALVPDAAEKLLQRDAAKV